MGDSRRPPGSGFRPPQRLPPLSIRLPSPWPVLPGIFEHQGLCQAGHGEPEGGPQGPRQGAVPLGGGGAGGEGSHPDKFRRLVLGALTGGSWGSWSIWCRHEGPRVCGMEPPGLWWLSKGPPDLDPSPWAAWHGHLGPVTWT